MLSSIRYRMLWSLALFGGLFVTAPGVSGQQVTSITPDIEEGMKTYGAFHGGDIDQVSLSSGKLEVNIPLVKNQGTAPITISGNIVNGPTIQPGATQQVSFTEVGNGTSYAQLGFLTANPSDNMDVLAFAPSITVTGTSTNLIPAANQDFAGWGTYLGSSVTLTPQASVAESLDYLPFGELNSTDSGTTSHKFTGKERDSESGLDNFGARYNSSAMGRYMSADPYNAGAFLDGPQTWNAYSYVLNNPLNAIDPNGLDCVYAAGASDNPNPRDDGRATVVRGDCKNEGGKNDSGVFVDNDENHPVQSSDVTLSNDGSVGLISYTRTDGLTTGYACMGNCPSDSVQVNASSPDTPTMSADTGPLTPFQRSLLPPPPKPLTTFQLRQIQGCMAFMDPALAGPMFSQSESPTDLSHPNEARQPNNKLNYVKDSKPKRPGPAGQANRNGERAGQAVNAAAGGFGVLADVGSCAQNAVQQ